MMQMQSYALFKNLHPHKGMVPSVQEQSMKDSLSGATAELRRERDELSRLNDSLTMKLMARMAELEAKGDMVAKVRGYKGSLFEGVWAPIWRYFEARTRVPFIHPLTHCKAAACNWRISWRQLED